MKRFALIFGASALLLGCGKDSAKDNPGAPVEWNKNPNAPKSYGDPAKSGPLGAPGKNGQPPVPGRR